MLSKQCIIFILMVVIFVFGSGCCAYKEYHHNGELKKEFIGFEPSDNKKFVLQ